MLMIATGAIAALLHYRKQLFDTRWFQLWCMALTPTGFIAVLAGWHVTEVGRQPWIVQGVMRTSEALTGTQGIAWLLAVMAVVYGVLSVGLFASLRFLAGRPFPEDSHGG